MGESQQKPTRVPTIAWTQGRLCPDNTFIFNKKAAPMPERLLFHRIGSDCSLRTGRP
ncbi:hypothetical protein AGR8A_Cc30740 [Agrobacterium fabrum str. J-07]|nr:hypothetical protein AGR8A_Cc30740 [Agrobacterium fabrum str. J-07]